MRTRVLAVFGAISAVFLWTGMAQADCDCTYYPMPGSYGTGDARFDLSYLDGSAYSCPTQMRISAPRRAADNADVMLTCEGGEWRGNEYTRIGTFSWLVSGASDYSHVHKNHKSAMEGSAGFGEQLTITMAPPPAIGRPPRSQSVAVEKPGQAPACFCTALKDNIFSAEVMIDAFSNKKVLEYAMRENLRADDNDSKTYMTEDGEIRDYAGDAGSQYSYTQMVDAFADGDLQWRGGDPYIANPTPQGSGSSDPSIVDAAAFTIPGSCRVKLGSDARKTCMTAWELQATLVHENTHRRQCLAKQKLNRYMLPSGQVVYPGGDNPNAAFESAYGRDIESKAGGLRIVGTLKNLDLLRFGDYASLPINRSAMEVEAYTAELKWSQAMLEKHCAN